MILKGKNYQTVLILGSGATRGALSHVLLNRKRIRPPLNSDFFSIAARFASACGPTSAEARRLQRLNTVFREYLPTARDSLTMESAFSLLFMAKDFPDIYSRRRGRQRAPGNGREIEDFLRLTFGILTILDCPASTHTEYDALVNALGPGDTIITLNYDTLLDTALVTKGWDPRNGYAIGGSASKFRWSPRTIDPNLRNVRLLKLHGSLNWFVRGSFSDLAAVFQKKPTSIERPRRNEIGRHVRQIVPPIYGKFFGHDHWRVLWSAAYKALREAEALIVVGCSLIDTDFHLRALIGRITRSRKPNPFRRVVLADRVVVRRKWTRALKGAFRRRSEYATFSELMQREVRS